MFLQTHNKCLSSGDEIRPDAFLALPFDMSVCLQADHHNAPFRSFGDARNLGAALNVFQTREWVAVWGTGGGARSRTLGWEVEEDMFAALV